MASNNLRRSFLVVTLAGAVLPLLLCGIWLTYAARRAGEQLLASQMDSTLARAATAINGRFHSVQSQVLLLANNEPVRSSLPTAPAGSQPPSYLQRAFAALSTIVTQASYFNSADRLVWQLTGPRVEAGIAGLRGIGDGGVVMRFPVVDDAGRKSGELVATVKNSALLIPDSASSGIAGSQFVAAYHGHELLISDPPLQLHAGLLRVHGRPWLVRQRSVRADDLTLQLAAPLDPFIAPFRRISLAGLLLVLVVGTGVVLLTNWLTNRVTRSTLDELARKQALARTGEFAGQLSHEVRNALSSARLDLQRALEKSDSDSGSHPLMQRALEHITRLDRTVTGALRVIRSGTVTHQRIDLRAPLREALHRTAGEFRARSTGIRYDEPAEPLLLDGDPAALEHLFTNLLLNAAQASRGLGAVEVSARMIDARLSVVIRDDGVGMDSDELRRVRTPLFTTKPDGSGLGLTITRRIADAHGGKIEIASERGCGTTVQVIFPAT